jgi:hypothetical protein
MKGGFSLSLRFCSLEKGEVALSDLGSGIWFRLEDYSVQPFYLLRI